MNLGPGQRVGRCPKCGLEYVQRQYLDITQRVGQAKTQWHPNECAKCGDMLERRDKR